MHIHCTISQCCCFIVPAATHMTARGCNNQCQVFCKHCFTTAFRNPLVCPRHHLVEPLIGKLANSLLPLLAFETYYEEFYFLINVYSNYVECAGDDKLSLDPLRGLHRVQH